MSGAVEDGQSCSWVLETGARLGRWRVVGRLGAGGYGAVYQVEEADRPGETYALKLALRPSDARAAREVELLARTQHRHVVRVHDWGLWQGPAGSHLYFVMDQVRGLPLHRWAQTVNPPLREVVQVACSLARTLDWLHEQGVRHRDLKPEHILIRASDSQPVLIDFGVGRQEGASTLTSTVVPPGTLHMRSPEAVDFHRLHYRDPDARYAFLPTDDLYALGVCLFRALTGYYPFSPKLPGDLLTLTILSHVPPAVADINRRVPRAFSAVVARLMEKKPHARYDSGRALYEALEEALALGPSRAWDATVFAWEEGPEPVLPGERRTQLPEWPGETATPSPEGMAPPGDGRPVSGATLLRVAEETHAPGGTLVRLDRKVTRGSLALRALAAFSVAFAAVAVGFVGRLAFLPATGFPPSDAGGAVAVFEGGRDAQVWEEAPSGGTPEPGGALVESAFTSDAGTMTHFTDTPGVNIPESPPVKKRGAARGALVAACVGAACAGTPQPPPRGSLDQPRPPPEECPQYALKAMEELDLEWAGDSTYDVAPPGYDGQPMLMREGPVVFRLSEDMRSLPQVGTTVVGRLFFAKGYVQGWFNEVRTKDGRSFPVCMELLDVSGDRGIKPEGPGAEPGTALVYPVGQVGVVKRFQ